MGRAGPGRPKGSKNLLPLGARRLIEAARSADEDDPDCQEAMGLLYAVMRGTVRARYTGFRLQAASMLLDRKRGKPKQIVEHSGALDITVMEDRMREARDQARPPVDRQDEGGGDE